MNFEQSVNLTDAGTYTWRVAIVTLMPYVRKSFSNDWIFQSQNLYLQQLRPCLYLQQLRPCLYLQQLRPCLYLQQLRPYLYQQDNNIDWSDSCLYFVLFMPSVLWLFP